VKPIRTEMSWFSSPPIPTYYEDEKSPTTIEDFRILRDEMFEQIETLKNSEWIFVDQGVPGVNFYKKQVEGYPIEMLRIETEVDGTPQEVSQFHDECTPEERATFDPQIKHFEVLEKFGDEVLIIYAIFKGMIPVADRDFIAFRATKVLDDGTYVNLGHSINYSKKPITANPVRAKGKVAIYHYPVCGNPYKCHMVKYVLTDPMGSIPKFLVAVAHKHITQSASKLTAFLQNKFGEKDRSVPLQLSLSERNETAQKDSSDDDSFCSLESYDDDEFSVIDTSQEICRIPLTSSIPLSKFPVVIAQPDSSLKHTTHTQGSPRVQSQSQQNYQWQNQNSNNDKILPNNEKIEKKTGNLDAGISDATITKTLVEIQKNVANLQRQIDRIERMQSRNSIFTHLFYFSWPIVVVVAYHLFRKKMA